MSNQHRERSQAKLSARIIAIAGPWIERLGPDPPLLAVEFAYQTCGAVWNASRVEGATDREVENEVRQLFDVLYERALVAWPNDRRTVGNLAVVGLGGGSFRVDVVSVTGGIAP